MQICRSADPGERPSCTHAVVWGHVKDESVGLPLNFYSVGSVVAHGLQRFQQ